MSQINTNAILDASGGTTTSINGYTPTASNMAGRNRIINGDMRIDQRNAGASVTPAQDNFIADRFKWGQSQASKFTSQQSTTAPAGFTNSLLLTVTSAVTLGASDYFSAYQPIEGFNVADLAWGTASAQAVTLSFKVRSSLTGTFGGVFRNASGTRSYPFTYTISAANTFEDKTITIPGDTAGTWLTNNGVGLFVQWGLGVGTTFSGTAGAWASANYLSATGATSVVGTSGATFYITGVQLEAGSVATPFEHRQYGQELALCQRYFETYSNGTGTGSIFEGLGGYFANSSLFRTAVPFKVTKRASPSISVPVTYVTVNSSAGNLTPSSAGSNFSSPDGATISCTVSGATGGQGGTVGFSSSAPVTISAEL